MMLRCTNEVAINEKEQRKTNKPVINFLPPDTFPFFFLINKTNNKRISSPRLAASSINVYFPKLNIIKSPLV